MRLIKSNTAIDFVALGRYAVIVSAVVLTVFILIEGRRIGLNHLWLPIACTFSVGVSFGLPVFLAMRERTLRAD